MSNWDPTAGDNPYDSPSSSFADKQSEGQITPRTVETMRQTRTWAMFVGVIGVIFGLLSLAVCLMGMMMISNVPPGTPEQAQMALGTAVQFVSGLVQLIVGSCALRFSGRTADFVASRSVAQLDLALQAQLTFWRVLGIIAAIMVGLIVLAFVLGVLAAAAQV